jgi:spore coat protein U-like protein
MIAASGQTGNIIEYQNNPRTQVLWGVTASGRTVMGNGSAAAVTMAPVYVAPASAVLPGDLPAGLPSGTVVVQLAS